VRECSTKKVNLDSRYPIKISIKLVLNQYKIGTKQINHKEHSRFLILQVCIMELKTRCSLSQNIGVDTISILSLNFSIVTKCVQNTNYLQQQQQSP
jgi:hypothetical protein